MGGSDITASGAGGSQTESSFDKWPSSMVVQSIRAIAMKDFDNSSQYMPITVMIYSGNWTVTVIVTVFGSKGGTPSGIVP